MQKLPKKDNGLRRLLTILVGGLPAIILISIIVPDSLEKRHMSDFLIFLGAFYGTMCLWWYAIDPQPFAKTTKVKFWFLLIGTLLGLFIAIPFFIVTLILLFIPAYIYALLLLGPIIMGIYNLEKLVPKTWVKKYAKE